MCLEPMEHLRIGYWQHSNSTAKPTEMMSILVALTEGLKGHLIDTQQERFRPKTRAKTRIKAKTDQRNRCRNLTSTKAITPPLETKSSVWSSLQKFQVQAEPVEHPCGLLHFTLGTARAHVVTSKSKDVQPKRQRNRRGQHPGRTVFGMSLHFAHSLASPAGCAASQPCMWHEKL